MLSRYVGRKVSAVSAILVLQHDIHDELEASTPFFDSLKVMFLTQYPTRNNKSNSEVKAYNEGFDPIHNCSSNIVGSKKCSST